MPSSKAAFAFASASANRSSGTSACLLPDSSQIQVISSSKSLSLFSSWTKYILYHLISHLPTGKYFWVWIDHDLHSSKLHNPFSHSDRLSSLHFLVHNLLKLSLRQCFALSNCTRSVAVIHSRRLKAEEFRTGLVNTANEGRETKRSDRTIRCVCL